MRKAGTGAAAIVLAAVTEATAGYISSDERIEAQAEIAVQNTFRHATISASRKRVDGRRAAAEFDPLAQFPVTWLQAEYYVTLEFSVRIADIEYLGSKHAESFCS